MIKWILILSFVLMKGYGAFKKYLNASSTKRSLPKNVKDVYSEEEYDRWKRYDKENGRVDLIEDIIITVILMLFLIFDIYARVFNLFSGCNAYLQYLLMILLFTVITMPVSIPFDYHRTFVIEEKYGMNKSTKKTFFMDILKSAVLEVLLSFVIMAVIMFFFEKYGNLGILFITLTIILFSLCINVLAVPIMRIFNKFTPLQEGKLKDDILALCGKYNVPVKKIVVKDASRRTTRANAFCTGIKKKTISLDDNLVNDYTSKQIVSVFAHEFAHAKYKHILKSLPFALLRTVLSIVAMGLVLNFPDLFKYFGFDGINYFFVSTLASLFTWPVSELLDGVSNYLSRRHEYQADAFAAKEGYGENLISCLKKLNKESLADINPHPFIVAMDYSHPTLSQRITAIRKISGDIRLVKVNAGDSDAEYFETINREAFPPEEYVSLDKMLSLNEKVQVDLLGIYRGDKPAGFFVCMPMEKEVYVFYFAIGKESRNMGIGSSALQELKKYYSSCQIAIDLEAIDENAENIEQRKSRRAFYIRNGFVPTGYFLYYWNSEFELISSTEPFDAEAFGKISSALHGAVPEFDPKMYTKENDEK